MASGIELLSRTITDHEQDILDDWTKELTAAHATSRAAGSISVGEQRSQTTELLALVRRAPRPKPGRRVGHVAPQTRRRRANAGP